MRTAPLCLDGFGIKTTLFKVVLKIIYNTTTLEFYQQISNSGIIQCPGQPMVSRIKRKRWLLKPKYHDPRLQKDWNFHIPNGHTPETSIVNYTIYGYITLKGNWNIFMDMPQKHWLHVIIYCLWLRITPNVFLFIGVMSLGHWVCENNLKGPPNLRHIRHVSTRASPTIGCQKAVILPPNHKISWKMDRYKRYRTFDNI